MQDLIARSYNDNATFTSMEGDNVLYYFVYGNQMVVHTYHRPSTRTTVSVVSTPRSLN